MICPSFSILEYDLLHSIAYLMSQQRIVCCVYNNFRKINSAFELSPEKQVGKERGFYEQRKIKTGCSCKQENSHMLLLPKHVI